MFKPIKSSVIALGVAAAMGVAGTAQADALAVSDILLNNLVFTNGTRVLDASDFAALTFTNSGQVTAQLGATPQTSAGNTTPLDLYACVGTGCPANKTFPFTLPPPVNTFATADQLESGSPISGVINPSTGTVIPTGATVNAGTYVSLADPNVGNAQSKNGLSSTFLFTLAGATPVTINFNAQEYLQAFTAAGQSFPTNALASTTVCFTVTPVGLTAPIINWCPDGVNNNDVGITASSEPFSLNVNASRNAPFNGSTQFGPMAGFFSGTTVTLLAGVPYQLSAVETATASALEIPEPGSLALLSAALLGFGFSRRKLFGKS